MGAGPEKLCGFCLVEPPSPLSVRERLGFVSLAPIPWQKRVIARGDGVRIAPATIAALDADLSAAIVADDVSGLIGGGLNGSTQHPSWKERRSVSLRNKEANGVDAALPSKPC